MSVSYNEKERIFRLDTPNTTYLLGLAGSRGILGQVYYGPSVPDDNMGYLMGLGEGPERPEAPERDLSGFNDGFPFEYPAWGNGDFRVPCLRVRDGNGAERCELFYESHRIFPGKPALEGLPASFGGEGDCESLEITLRDPILGLRVRLLYTAFTHIDAICRSVRIENAGGAPVTLLSALSSALTLDGRGMDLITLHGSWARERTVDRRPLANGRQGVGSGRGITSHQHSPSMVLCEHTATQERGRAYGMTLVYSGSFTALAEMDYSDSVRAVLGINPEGFSWLLAPGESFQTPEAILVCSDRGLGGMSRTFHDLMRRHLIRGQNKYRPPLLNCWEAYYFDYDMDRLLALGREAAASGIELMVLDDGWFGKRNSDTSSLGDWYVNEEKLPGGLKRLGEELGRMGVKLGIWMEPEMVSPDSDLYRAHPDYALSTPGRTSTLHRSQLVLDMGRREVREQVYSQVKAVLSSAPIAYLKWDMNRPLTDLWSPSLPPERQGEVSHRYMLGVYELQERLVNDFPDLLLENCSAGGARFDAGMLYYGPQIWTSDNAEAVERLRIQEGTALFYPFSAMGAHVAACPSHTNGRATPFATRGLTALPGAFGYELDLARLAPEERAMIPEQIERYKNLGPVFRDGDYYRLESFAENGLEDAFMAVTKDASLAVIIRVQVLTRANRRPSCLHPAGLCEAAMYRDRSTGVTRSGAAWMRGGILSPTLCGDFAAELTVLERV